MKCSKIGYIVAAAACAAICSKPVSADIAPLPGMFSVEQEGQDVTVTVTRKASTIDAVGEDSFNLIRSQSGVETAVVSGVRLSMASADTIEPACGEYYNTQLSIDEFCGTYPDKCLNCDDAADTICIGEDCESCMLLNNTMCCDAWEENPEFCAANFCPGDIDLSSDFCTDYPDYMVDCDGDGTAECCLTCDDDVYFEYVDTCVPPGPTEYSLQDEYGDGDSMSVDVTNTGDTCLDDLPEDTDTQGSTDEPEDSETQMSTDKPEDTDTQGSTDEPEDSETPVSTDEPEDSDTSASTDEPEDSETLVSTDDSPSTEPESSDDTKTDTDVETDTDTETETEPRTDTDTDTETSEKPAAGSGGCSFIPGAAPQLSSNLLSLLKAVGF